MPGYVFRLIPPRSSFAIDMSSDERATMLEHAGYWHDLTAQGKVLAFGPVDDPAGIYGIGIIVAADLAEATALGDSDPAVRSGHGFRAELAPMLSLVTPDGIHEAPADPS